MASTLSWKKNKNPYGPDDRVRAWQSFGHAAGTVREGDVLRGDDPLVAEHHPWFESVDTPTAERKTVWLEMPPPPDHAPEVAVQTIQIPPHRIVRSLVDVSAPLSWSSPDSPGAQTNVPPPFARTSLRRGQLVDALHPLVREHVDWFVWPERHVLIEDIERVERHEHEGPE
jgi:hypothetical protein